MCKKQNTFNKMNPEMQRASILTQWMVFGVHPFPAPASGTALQ